VVERWVLGQALVSELAPVQELVQEPELVLVQGLVQEVVRVWV